MSKRLPSIVLFLIAGALLIYTASQTLDLLKLFLSAEQAPLAYLGLVAFDGGLLGWSYYFAKGAKGSWQRSIAAIMIVVSIIAVVVGFGAETFFRASEKGLVIITQEMSIVVVWCVCGVIAANVVAVVVTHLSSPEARKTMAEEEARDVIEDAIIEAIRRSAPMTAAAIVPGKVEEWVEKQIHLHLPTGRVIQSLPAPQSIALPQEATIETPKVVRPTTPAPTASNPVATPATSQVVKPSMMGRILGWLDSVLPSPASTLAQAQPTPTSKKVAPTPKNARLQKMRGQSGGSASPLA